MQTQSNTAYIEELFQLGAHLGHKKSRVHPRARKYIYKIMNGTSIIDLAGTVEQLEKAKAYLAQCVQEDKVILVVATKKIISGFMRDYCLKHGIPHITTKWLPGLLTNFETLMKNVQKLQSMIDAQKNGEWDGLVNHERVRLAKEKARLEKLYGGILTLQKKPDIIVLVDARKERNVVKEAMFYGIPTVGLIDTNANPAQINYPVLANDDTALVVSNIMSQMLEPYANRAPKAVKAEVKTA